MFRTAFAVAVTGTLAFAAVPPLQEMEMQMPKPTKEHAELHKSVGTWEGTVTMLVPGLPQEPIPATETVRAHGPFWTLSDFHSELMGMPYEGHGSQGYSPQKEKYVGTWIDNTSSWLAVMQGEYDDEGKLVMHWDAPDMTGAIQPHRSELTMDGDDAYTMVFFTGDQKIMEIQMERTSSKPAEAGAPMGK